MKRKKVEIHYVNLHTDYLCDAQTCHLYDCFGHPDFQIVLNIPSEDRNNILATFCYHVQQGEKFKSGDVVGNILEGYDVRLQSFTSNERLVLRILFPDDNGKFPGDKGCEYPYSMQTLSEQEMLDLTK